MLGVLQLLGERRLPSRRLACLALVRLLNELPDLSGGVVLGGLVGALELERLERWVGDRAERDHRQTCHQRQGGGAGRPAGVANGGQVGALGPGRGVLALPPDQHPLGGGELDGGREALQPIEPKVGQSRHLGPARPGSEPAAGGGQEADRQAAEEQWGQGVDRVGADKQLDRERQERCHRQATGQPAEGAAGEEQPAGAADEGVDAVDG